MTASARRNLLSAEIQNIPDLERRLLPSELDDLKRRGLIGEVNNEEKRLLPAETTHIIAGGHYPSNATNDPAREAYFEASMTEPSPTITPGERSLGPWDCYGLSGVSCCAMIKHQVRDADVNGKAIQCWIEPQTGEHAVLTKVKCEEDLTKICIYENVDGLVDPSKVPILAYDNIIDEAILAGRDITKGAGPPPLGMEASPSCMEGYTCLQNTGWGEVDATKYKIDLSLETLPGGWPDAYVVARDKWMSLIVGDLESVQKNKIPAEANHCGAALPSTVDDLHICGQDKNIDGYGKILGSASPTEVRVGTGKAIVGNMKFDVADINWMVSDGIWEGVILHEMGVSALFCIFMFILPTPRLSS